MTSWTEQQLRAIDAAEELHVSSLRPDGTLRPPVTIWHTTVGDALYLRAARGVQSRWFQRALHAGIGRIDAGGITQTVSFQLAGPAVRDALDAALHRKYDRYGPGPVAAITGDNVLDTTLKVLPSS